MSPTSAVARGDTLTAKQARFVELYLVSLNATDAYREAYGVTGKSAEVGGTRTLGAVKVKAAIEAAQSKRAKRLEISADKVLRELATIGFSDVRHFEVDNEGRLTLADGAPDRAWRAVQSVKHKIRTFTTKDGDSDTTREIEFRLWNKNDALDKIAKRIQFYPPEKVNLTGEVVLGIVAMPMVMPLTPPPVRVVEAGPTSALARLRAAAGVSGHAAP